MRGGTFNLLNIRGSGRQSAKQAKVCLSGLLKILQIGLSCSQERARKSETAPVWLIIREWPCCLLATWLT